jgi:hypothetical protein
MTPTSIRGHLYICCCCWLLLAVIASSSASDTHALSSPSPRTNRVVDWVQARCGGVDKYDETPALWVYQGALYDPLDGKRIAQVQGLELVSKWADCYPTSTNTGRGKFQYKVGDLIAGALIGHPDSKLDYAATMLSRKLFVYTPSNDNQKLLTSIRVRPRSPLKPIPTDQSVVLYDTATTIISRGKELIVHSEFPDFRSLWGQATLRQENTNDKDTLDFTVYTKRRSDKSADSQPDLLAPPQQESSTTNPEITVSPKRSALIQFGSSNLEEKHRFGARETYSYSIPKNSNRNTNTPPSNWWQRLVGGRGQDNTSTSQPSSSCRVKYTRYGEGPPFYAPGRMCALELTGRRVETLEDIERQSPLLHQVLRERIPGFFIMHPSLFRRAATQILPDPNAPLPSWKDKGKAKADLFVQRVRAATTLKSGPSKGK